MDPSLPQSLPPGYQQVCSRIENYYAHPPGTTHSSSNPLSQGSPCRTTDLRLPRPPDKDFVDRILCNRTAPQSPSIDTKKSSHTGSVGGNIPGGDRSSDLLPPVNLQDRYNRMIYRINLQLCDEKTDPDAGE